jgi:hypothetical protein
VLFVAGGKAKQVYGVDQLCAGREVGIKGGIHVMHLLWDKEWGFLLVGANNAFNEGNQMAMCWTVHHLWPSRAWFTFNCYRYWLTLEFNQPMAHLSFCTVNRV